MFFWDYYSEGEAKAHLAKLLKPLTTPDQLVGQIVDNSINEALSAYRFDGALPTDLPNRGAKAFMRHAHRSPQIVANIHKNHGVPSGAKPFHNDFYGYPLPEGTLSRCAQKVRDCLFNFEVSEVWEAIKEVDPSNWCPPKRAGDINAVEWSLGDLKVWSAIDFYFRKGDSLYIIDWKAGRGSEKSVIESAKQVASYALWGNLSQGLEPEQIFTQAVFLVNEPLWEPVSVPISQIESTRAWIEEEHAAERALITLEGVGPRDRPRYFANSEDFAASPEVARCHECKYRKICPEGKALVDDYAQDEEAVAIPLQDAA